MHLNYYLNFDSINEIGVKKYQDNLVTKIDSLMYKVLFK